MNSVDCIIAYNVFTLTRPKKFDELIESISVEIIGHSAEMVQVSKMRNVYLMNEAVDRTSYFNFGAPRVSQNLVHSNPVLWVNHYHP